MTSISNRLHTVRTRINDLAHELHIVYPISLLAVSKTWPVACIKEAAEAGQYAFGENYVQEAITKIEQLAALNLEWHFIGPIQSNKTRLIATYFNWVHTIDRIKIAQRLSEQRASNLPDLNICIQVNVSGEESKSGIAPGEVDSLIADVIKIPRLRLRGLMTIPEPSDDENVLRQRFRCLRELHNRLNAKYGLNMDTLSMGMSHDYELAIAEGATIVRVGSAIFGERG